MSQVRYEIKQELGILSYDRSGWSKEVNMISWNDRPARLDIRCWSPDHAKMNKGLTFTKEEVLKLNGILKEALN